VAAIAHQQAGAPILTHTEQRDQRQPSRQRLLRVRCWLARCWKRQQAACSAIDMAAKSRSCFPPPRLKIVVLVKASYNLH
jgi:hypothetical protein